MAIYLVSKTWVDVVHHGRPGSLLVQLHGFTCRPFYTAFTRSSSLTLHIEIYTASRGFPATARLLLYSFYKCSFGRCKCWSLHNCGRNPKPRHWRVWRFRREGSDKAVQWPTLPLQKFVIGFLVSRDAFGNPGGSRTPDPTWPAMPLPKTGTGSPLMPYVH